MLLNGILLNSYTYMLKKINFTDFRLFYKANAANI